MHYTGTIWRPPYEGNSLLLETTVGCTHHACKFCTLYDDLPYQFKMADMKIMEADLKEAGRASGLWRKQGVKRTFLTGANPFILHYEKLMAIAEMIRKYLPYNETIGSFARITDIAAKTDEQLRALRSAGYDGLTIGMETADDRALKFMKKGYSSKDIVEQCSRLDNAGITYKFFYLVGISGAGNGEQGAKVTAEVCNSLHPEMVGANMLTIYDNSELYQEICKGNWEEESEIEKYKEIKTLVENLTIHTEFAALGASNAVQIQGNLQEDKKAILSLLDEIIQGSSEKALRKYRTNIKHL